MLVFGSLDHKWIHSPASLAFLIKFLQHPIQSYHRRAKNYYKHNIPKHYNSSNLLIYLKIFIKKFTAKSRINIKLILARIYFILPELLALLINQLPKLIRSAMQILNNSFRKLIFSLILSILLIY